MELDAKYSLVGMIVVAIAAALTFFCLWLSNNSSRDETKIYSIYFKHQSLAGLQEDSSVTMKGIKVGIVDDLNILPQDIERVKVNIQVSSETPIKEDTEAIIQRNLLTGLATIELSGSTQASPNLTRLVENEEFPVIPEGENSLAAIQKTLPEVINNAAEVLHRASLILSDQNRETLGKTFSNIEMISANLAKGEGELKETVENINALVKDLRMFIDNVGKEAGELEASLRNTSETIAREVSSASKSLIALGSSIRGTARELENPRKLIFGPNKETLGPGERP